MNSALSEDAEEIIFHISFCWRCPAWSLKGGLTSTKPIHKLLSRSPTCGCWNMCVSPLCNSQKSHLYVCVSLLYNTFQTTRTGTYDWIQVYSEKQKWKIKKSYILSLLFIPVLQWMPFRIQVRQAPNLFYVISFYPFRLYPGDSYNIITSPRLLPEIC